MTKNPNSDFYTSKSQSQDLGSIDPLLDISEPPDLKNWFSSYKYESPELDTGDGFEGFNNFTVGGSEDVSYVEDSIKEKDEEETYVEDSLKEKEENFGVIGGLNNGDEFESCGGLKGSDVDEDISYVEDSIDEKYEDLGVIRDINTTDFGDDHGKDGSYVEDSIKQKYENLGLFGKLDEDSEIFDHDIAASKEFVSCVNFVANKVADMSDTLGLSSEPQDIKNWFSSYVYESPALDTSDEFGLSSYDERKTARAGVHIGMSIKLKEKHVIEDAITVKRDDLVGRKRASAGFNRTSSSAEVNNDDHQIQGMNEAVGEKVSSVVTDLPLDSEETDTSILSDRDSSRKPKRKFPHNDSRTPPDINISSVIEENSPRKLLSRSKFTEKGSEGKPQDNTVVTVSPRSNSHFTASNRSSLTRTDTSNNKENGKNDHAENGFISARKNRCRKENDKKSVSTPLGAHSENNIQVSAGSNKVVNIIRRALTDTTNTQPCDVLGVAGKWRCPQKSKPNLGPPMKQLRLERWVHRI